MNKPSLVVMAAGIGSRYGSVKQIDTFGPHGETIIDYSIYDAIQAGFGKVVFIIRKSIEEEFQKTFYNKFADKIKIEYVFQEVEKVPEGINFTPERQKPWGTGHALLMAHEKVNEPFAVINADDFYGQESFRIIASFLSQLSNGDQGDYALIGYQLNKTLSEHGHVSRGVCSVNSNNHLQGVTERTKIYRRNDGNIVYLDEQDGEEKVIDDHETVSMNLFGFTPDIFGYLDKYFREFIENKGDDLKSEFYLPFVINQLIKKGKVDVNVLKTPEQWFGVTYPEDKPVARDKIADLIRQGYYPEKLWSE